MKQLKYCLPFLFFYFFQAYDASADEKIFVLTLTDNASFNELDQRYELQEIGLNDSPNPFFKRLFKTDQNGKSKTVAAMLAFPVTGITGIHRVYLGTRAYVPVVYVGTLGGCVGILPLVDFVVLLIDKDITPYENNGKVFMWLK